jgi:anti-anti-sigma factor
MQSQGSGPVFRLETTRDASILHVSGDLDFASRGGLLDFFAQAEAGRVRRVVVSLMHCAYCDSASLSLLLGARKRLGERFFVVLPVTTRIRRLFEIVGVVESDFIVASLADALNEPR